MRWRIRIRNDRLILTEVYPAHRARLTSLSRKEQSDLGKWAQRRMDRERRGVEQAFRSVVAPMQVAQLSGTARSHSICIHLIHNKHYHTLSIWLIQCVDRGWVVERDDPSCCVWACLFLHLRLCDISITVNPGPAMSLSRRRTGNYSVDALWLPSSTSIWAMSFINILEVIIRIINSSRR